MHFAMYSESERLIYKRKFSPEKIEYSMYLLGSQFFFFLIKVPGKYIRIGASVRRSVFEAQDGTWIPGYLAETACRMRSES